MVASSPRRVAARTPSQPLGRLTEAVGPDRERDPEVAFARRAERAARAAPRHRSPPVRAGARSPPDAIAGRQRHPQVHRRLGRLQREPGLAERRHSGVAPPLELLPDRRDDFLRPVEHGGSRLLHREERPGVHVRLHPGERADQLGPSRGEAEPPAGHREALGEREELERDLPAPGISKMLGAR